MEWWVIGLKQDVDGNVSYLVSESQRLPIYQHGIVQHGDLRVGRASPGTWVMSGGVILDVPLFMGRAPNGEQMPDLSQLDPFDLVSAHGCGQLVG